MTVSTKPVLFLAFANDRDDRARYLRNLAEEARQVQKALGPAEQRGHCELVVRQNTTAGDILDVFQDARYRDRIALFHFGGHADGYRLLLETAEGKPAAAAAGGLAAFLGQQRGLQLVFLNGCSTEGQLINLQDAGVPAVIATDQAVDDAMATAFAARFYQGLAGGAAIGPAFEEAKAEMQIQGGAVFRHLGAAGEEQTDSGRLPWRLHIRPGAEAVSGWSLPQAVRDPLFGLPPLPPLDLPDTPYRYLDWYRREDAEVFFGRGHEIRDLYDRVTAAGSPPLVLFYGQSGVGKSSLLAAGLLPRLEGSLEVRYGRRDQAKGLLGTLAATLAAAPEDDLAAAWRGLETQSGKPLLVVLDQVEELFTRPNPQQADEMAVFLTALEKLFADAGRRPQGRLVLSFRKEWLAEINQRLVERKLPRGEVFLERLGREGIAEVVAGPQATAHLRDRYGLTVVEALPDLIAGDLLDDRESPVAPLLAILMTDMWDAAKKVSYDHPVFDEDLYHEFRSRGLSLDDFLGRQLQALHGKQPEVVDSGLALDVLTFHVSDLGTAAQRIETELNNVYRHQVAVLPDLVRQCQDLYLLVDPRENRPGEPPSTRLAHDTLAPHVRKRFDGSNAPGQRARRILESRTRESRSEVGRRILLGANELDLVKQGASGMPAWSDEQRELVRISQGRAIRIKWLQRIALFVVLVLAAIPVAQQIRDYSLRRAAGRPQITFPAAVVKLGDPNPGDPRTSPPREVSVAAFAIDKFEVSYDQYRLCIRAGKCSRPRQPAQTQGFDDVDTADGSLPVVWIDAYQAATFCRWMGKQLPTEAEWERAARGPTFRPFPWGDGLPNPAFVNSFLPDFPDEAPQGTAPVADAAFASGATPEGIMHLLGNVAEWTASSEECQDDAYNCGAVWDGVKAVSTVFARGGSWQSDLVSPAYYDSTDPFLVDSSIGFRCAQRKS